MGSANYVNIILSIIGSHHNASIIGSVWLKIYYHTLTIIICTSVTIYFIAKTLNRRVWLCIYTKDGYTLIEQSPYLITSEYTLIKQSNFYSEVLYS